MKFFDSIQSFFSSIGEYVKNFSYLFLIFAGAFLLLTVIVVAITSFSYETMLTKTIDKINKFLEHNPRINDDNLVAFNNLMKAKSVPKALRRQWQQFMLYREHPASYYMSFQHCVENPLRNSVYKQQMAVYKVLCYVLSALSLVVSVFMAVQSINSNLVLQDIVIIPICILIGYWLVSMVLDLIHNATSSDLFQNYQYFEINIDKAMITLPEFVDYEVLFSQEEIRRGIPVLFAYLQKRAVQEQQELEKARLTTVNHEKFDFDEAGLDGSLVLDRAMRETENFASQRKKYMQETERVNNEISALESNYKEQIKDYQRQVQTSKETVDNLKEQLEQATSTIEINYIKKQIRDEINRQQLSEKEFDITTDKYNQETRNLNQEIKQFDEETKKAKRALESAMMSEFSTYSVKVYNNLEKIVDDKMRERLDGFKGQINELETKLEEKNEELENVYMRYQEVLAETPAKYRPVLDEEEPVKKGKKNKKKKGNADGGIVLNGDDYAEQGDQQYADYQGGYNEYSQPMGDYQEGGNNLEYNSEGQYDNNQYYGETQATDNQYGYDQAGYNTQENEPAGDYQEQTYQPLEQADEQPQYSEPAYVPLTAEEDSQTPQENVEADSVEPQETYATEPVDNANNQDFVYVPLDEGNSGEKPKKSQPIHERPADDEDDDGEFDSSVFDFDFALKEDKQSAEEQTKDAPDDEGEDDVFDFDADEDEEPNDADDENELPAPKPTRRVGRPRKVVSEDDIRPKRPVGRPKKAEGASSGPKRSVGRPRKSETSSASKRSVGRPKKSGSSTGKRPVGRPKKNA